MKTCNRHRTGGVYIAVLGTSLVVALLGLAAVMGQRIQNRMLVAAGQIRQAQLNANSAVELALLKMKQDANWRTNLSNGSWLTINGGVYGTCVATVTDPVDGNLANSSDDPVVILGIGTKGQAAQSVEVTVDPRKSSLSCLDSAIAVGNEIDLSGDILCTEGTISATTINASSSQVYGNVKAGTIGGSTYHGTSTTITAQQKPTMPTWSSVFNYYRTNGTQIPISNLPTSTPNLARNVGFDTNTQDWTGNGTGIPSAEISRDLSIFGHAASLRVHTRGGMNTSGATQYVDHFVKGGASYNISVELSASQSEGNVFRIKLATKGTGAVQTSTSSAFSAGGTGWVTYSATLTAPSWSGPLQYARLTIDTDDLQGRTDSFYVDNIDIRENTSGRFIYRQVIGSGVNPFGATNAQGLYWIDCNGSRLVIERSRIRGTLLVVNPGNGSCIGEGPISWAPAMAGYPALMVDADTASDADFAILASNRGLSETENLVNYNPTGATHDDLGTDTDTSDIFRSSIRGLVVIEDDFSFANSPLIQGQLVVGGDISSSNGALEVEFLPDAQLNPPPSFFAPETYMRRPTSTRKVVFP